MRIESSGGIAANALRGRGEENDRRSERVARENPSEIDAARGRKSRAEGDAGERTADASGERGVIRLLREGHFKGVADVRLRINFREELAALDDAARNQSAPAALGDLAEGFAGKIGELGEGMPEEDAAELARLMDELGVKVSELRDGVEAGSMSWQDARGEVAGVLDGLIGAFEERFSSPAAPAASDGGEESALDASVAGLGEPAGPDAEIGEAVGDAASPDGETTTDGAEALAEASVFDAAAFLEGVRSAVAEALGGFDAAMTASSTLPPLSPPSGKGRAYEKFLAIYQGGAEAGDGASAPGEGQAADGPESVTGIDISA